MRLATLRDGTPDGALVVVSDDAARVVRVGGNLLGAMADWQAAQGPLAAATARLAAGEGEAAASAGFAAPLPRSWQ